MNLLAELKRRNVIRMSGLYLVGAWLVIQVAATLLPVFGAPDWVMKVLVGLLATGFLAALVFSWVFELTPGGLKRDADIAPSESITPQTARRLDRMIIVVLLLALGYFAFDKFLLVPERVDVTGEARIATAAADRAPDATPSMGVPQRGHSKSIAVLAFADLSQGKDQE